MLLSVGQSGKHSMKRWHLSSNFKVSELPLSMREGRGFQAEETARAKTETWAGLAWLRNSEKATLGGAEWERDW